MGVTGPAPVDHCKDLCFSSESDESVEGSEQGSSVVALAPEQRTDGKR